MNAVARAYAHARLLDVCRAFDLRASRYNLDDDLGRQARGKHEASEARRHARFHAFNYASPTGCTSIIIPAIELFNAAYLTDLYGVSLLPLNRLEPRDPSRLSIIQHRPNNVTAERAKRDEAIISAA